MNTALLSGAILSAAAVGAAGLVLGVKQHRERCALATAQMHLRLLADQEERPQVDSSDRLDVQRPRFNAAGNRVVSRP